MCSKCQIFSHCAIQSAISLMRSITIKPRLHFWHLEMKAMFCLYLPLETRPDIIGDLSSLTGVLGSAQWSLTTLCSLKHTGLHFQAQLISSLSAPSCIFSTGWTATGHNAEQYWEQDWMAGLNAATPVIIVELNSTLAHSHTFWWGSTILITRY